MPELERAHEYNFDLAVIGGGSGGGNSDGGHYIWDHRYSLSEQEMADRMSDFRDLLLQKLEAAGANIHGRGSTGNPDSLIAFTLSYSHADAESMIWARRVSHGEGDHSVFIVWHGVKVD